MRPSHSGTMEHQLEEIERAIYESKLHLEEMTSALAACSIEELPLRLPEEPGLPRRQRPRVERTLSLLQTCPDGASAPRPHRPPEDRMPNCSPSNARGTSTPQLHHPPEAWRANSPRTTTPWHEIAATVGASPQPQAISPAEHGASAAPRTAAKLPKFDGSTPLEPYLSQVRLAAAHSGWSNEEAATHLALALDGKALQVLLDVSPAEQRDLEALTSALQRRFGQRLFDDQSREKLANRNRREGESLGTFAADVQLYAHRGYPQFQASAREELALHAFLRGLAPEGLRQHVRLAMPQSLDEALREAERAEAVFSTTSPIPKASTPRPQVRLTACGEDEVETEESCHAQQTQQWTPSLRRRRPRACDRCGEPGHFARDCPAPTPKRSGRGPTRGLPPEPPTPAQGRCTLVGRLGHTKGLYLDCLVNDQPCRALVDTGSTISLIRPGVLPDTTGPLPSAWSPTSTQLMTVTGEKAAMRGKRRLSVAAGDKRLEHELWLADIHDPCIIGLDLLTRWGAVVDTAKTTITIGAETMKLQTSRSSKEQHQHQPMTQSSSAEAVEEPSPPSISEPPPPQQGQLERMEATTRLANTQPSAETVNAVFDLWRRSSDGLDPEQGQRLKELLDENTDLFAARDEDCGRTALVQHSIDTGSAQPIRLRPHRLSLNKRQVVEEMVQEMLAAGVIEPSTSPWAAPVVLVRRKTGRWRFCADYRRLNAVTRKDSYPLPRVDDALDYLSGSSWFSSLDLRSGYWQVELDPEARPKTAFTTGQGLWQFRVMPFGLCNAPATFERLMERVLADVPKSRCVVYLDDLLVHATDFDRALTNLREVFANIRQAGLRLNPAKCQLLSRETEFLGHIVSGNGIATNPAKVSAVQGWPVPANVNELRSFLGLASYYRRFVQGFATIASPLHRLTDQGRQFEWDDACSAAFNELKAALTQAPVLAYPDVQQPFIVDTDASNVGVGAVLSQGGEGEERAVAYFSRALSRAEKNYCVTRRELLAVVLAVRHFRPYLHGNRFLLRTDHASLTWLLNFKQPEGQVARWLEALQEFDFEIQHRAGKHHRNADALSRRPCALEECRHCQRQEERDQASPMVATIHVDQRTEGWLPLTSEQLKQHQESDGDLARVRQWLDAGQRPGWQEVSALGPELKAFHSQWGNFELHDGVMYRRWQAPGRGTDLLQLLVPRKLRAQVLQVVHGSVGAGHFGNAKTLHRLRQRFYWPNCRRDVELHVHCCDACTAQKGPPQRSHAPLQQYLVGAPMERVGVDILGPFPVTESGNRYVLVAMDYFTKWPEAYAVPDQSAATTAERLVEEMFTRFGAPAELHSDQGRNFESQVFGEVCRRLGVTKTRTTPLHPQSDGLVERFNRTLATQLAILTNQHQRDWDRHLPLVLWSYRTAVQESSQCTPAALMFGRELRTPVDLVFGAPPEPDIAGGGEMDYFRRLRDRLQVVHDYAREAQSNAGVRQKRAYDAQCRGQAYKTGDKVWVFCPTRKKGLSPKLQSHWQGPGEVLSRLSEVVYRVRMPGRGRLVVLHQDRLAPYRPHAPVEAGGEASGEEKPLSPPPAPGRPVRRRGRPQHLRDYVLGDGVVGDD